MNERFEASTDAKSQLKFLEELDKMEKKRHDDQEWEKIMKAAKVSLEIIYYRYQWKYKMLLEFEIKVLNRTN